MAQVACPIECVGVGCPQPDFIERNGAWLLTVVGVVVGCFGGLLSYFLKSRCSKIKCCGLQLERQVVQLDSDEVGVDMSQSSKPE
jgi:hypothetical protein